MEAKIQQALKRFPNSSVSSLIRNWLTIGRANGHQIKIDKNHDFFVENIKKQIFFLSD